jgi:hypothetical protein
MYAQNTLQMEWCLDCHRNPSKNLRPTSQIYNMDWQAPSEDKPVWCAVGDEKSGMPTAESVRCTQTPDPLTGMRLSSLTSASLPTFRAFTVAKFTSQEDMGHFLEVHYKIRTPKDLTSCEVCHR